MQIVNSALVYKVNIKDVIWILNIIFVTIFVVIYLVARAIKYVVIKSSDLELNPSVNTGLES